LTSENFFEGAIIRGVLDLKKMTNYKNTSFYSWMVVWTALCLSMHISGCMQNERKAPNWFIERLGGEDQWLNSPASIKFAPPNKTPVIDADLKYLNRLSGLQKIFLGAKRG